MFPRYRVYAEFEGLDAKERAEELLARCEELSDIEGFVPPGGKEPKWRIVEDREY